MGNANCTENVHVQNCQANCTSACNEIDTLIFADCNEQVLSEGGNRRQY